MSDLGLGSEPGQVVQFAVGPYLQVNTILVLLESMGQEKREKDPKEGWDQFTALLEFAVDGE